MTAFAFLVGCVFGAAATIVAGCCLVAARGGVQREPAPAGAAPSASPAPSHQPDLAARTMAAVKLNNQGIPVRIPRVARFVVMPERLN